MFTSLTPLATRLRRRLAAALVIAVAAALPAASPAQAADPVFSRAAAGGYWMVATDGGIFSFGNARFFGSTGNIKLNQPIVGIAATPTGNGYWMVATDGGIFAFGDARFFGSTGNIKLNKPIVGMASTPSGNGYWLVATDGGIFAFGDARFYGSTGNIKLNKPIVGMASTPSGNGYWFVASDGGIFAFGDAAFYGSAGNLKLAKPIVGMASTPSGKGYWFTTSDGNVYPYGDARFYGAASSRPARDNRVVAALIPSPSGAGYWQASATGEVLAYGDAADFGDLPHAPNLPIVGMTPLPTAALAVPSGTPGATGVPSGSTPTSSGGTGSTTPTTATGPTTGTAPTTTTVTTSPTTTTTLPPAGGPSTFSSTANYSWGTPNDRNRSFVNSSGDTVYPYAQKVSAVAEIGDRAYIGGEFTDLVDTNRTPSGIPLAYLAELDTNGIPVPGSRFNATVRLDGAVRALYRSPDGRRLYVGGEFKHVNGEARARLVALDPGTGEIDRSFNPPEPSGYVAAITQAGSRLYVAGAFARLGLVTQPGLAALDAAGGAIDTGFVPPPRYTGRFEGHTGTRNDNPVTNGDPTGVITSLLLTPGGQYLMVGGTFLHFGYDHVADPDHHHSGLIALDPATGALTLWQPDQGTNSSRPVFGMDAYPGNPTSIGVNAPVLIYTAMGGAGGRVMAWVPGKKTTRLWRGNMDGDVMGVAATKDRVYVVGHYDHTVPDPNDPCLDVRDLGDGTYGVSCPDGTTSRHLAAFYASGEIVDGKNTGKARIDTEFTAQADTAEGPYAVLVGANQLYVAGNFSKISSTPVTTGGLRVSQPGLAVFPRAS